MTDILPEQLLQACPDDHTVSDPGCYALEIDLPDDANKVADMWHEHYEELPPYYHRLVDCHTAIYVGAASDVQARLEDHLDKEVRKASLPTVFRVTGLRDVSWYTNTEDAFQMEYNTARDIDRETDPLTYTHSR